MASPADRLKAVRETVRLRVTASRQEVIASIRLTRGTLIATRKLLVDVGLIEEKKTDRKARYIPFDAFWVAWWVVFLIGLILPTYSPEPFVVFPAVLALAVVWLFGMAQFTHTLLGADLRDVKLTPAGWKVLVQSYRDAGIPLPDDAMTDESALAASKELEGSLPSLARKSVLDWTALAAIQAILAGVVAMVGLLVGPTLADVRWWHGWSPVAVLYGVSLPTGLSLLFFGLVPFIVSRFLAALRLRSETASAVFGPGGAPPEVTPTGSVTASAVLTPGHPKRRRRRSSHPASAEGNHG